MLLLEGMVVGGVGLCIVPYGGRTRFWNGQTLDSGENHTWELFPCACKLSLDVGLGYQIRLS